MIKQVVILRSVLPNSKRWVFHWIREVVIPDLLEYQSFRKVRVIITYSDQI